MLQAGIQNPQWCFAFGVFGGVWEHGFSSAAEAQNHCRGLDWRVDLTKPTKSEFRDNVLESGRTRSAKRKDAITQAGICRQSRQLATPLQHNQSGSEDSSGCALRVSAAERTAQPGGEAAHSLQPTAG